MNEREIQLLKLRKLRLQQQKEKLQCENSYREFVKSAWHVLEGDKGLIWNWHLDYLCDEVQKQIERIGEGRPKEYDLLVNVPPRSLKSMIFTRMAAPWAWIHFPRLKFMRGSYAEELALEHSVETRDIIRSPWYVKNWGSKIKLKIDQDTKSNFKNTLGGACFITAPTSRKTTGRGANIVSLDDPLSADQAESEKDLLRHIRWYRRTLKSRLNDQEIDMFWIIMQRLHEEDLTGYILTNEGHKYKHICLPAQDCKWVSPPDLKKFYVNGLLFPKRFPKKFLDEIKQEDPYVHAGQYMQRPSPEEGGMFKRNTWRFWVPKGVNVPDHTITIGLETFRCETVELPDSFDDMVCSWDFAFKDKATSDYVSGHVIGSKGPNDFILDEFHKKVGYNESCRELLKLKLKWPLTTNILIEDKANGSAIIDDIKHLTEGVKAIQATGGDNTHTKANVTSKKQNTGNIILPHPAICSWTEEFIEEFTNYPNAAHDDRVSSVCQGIVYIRNSKPVIPAFRQKPVSIKINWKGLEDNTTLYISQWVEPNMYTSIVLALWNSRTGRLAIFDELTISTPTPEIIRDVLEKKIINNSAGVLTSVKKFEWYGNALMFARSERSSNRHAFIRDGIAETYSRHNIDLIDNEYYDEAGSIMLINNMAVYKKLIVDAKAIETYRQLSSWCYEGNEPGKQNGCARAVCNLASALYESGKMQKLQKKLKPYSKEKEIVLKKLEDEEKFGRPFTEGDLDEAMVNINSNRWMV